jgi:hypothetical protein
MSSDSISASWQRFSGVTALTEAEITAICSVFNRPAFEALDIGALVTLRESSEIVFNEEGDQVVQNNLVVGTIISGARCVGSGDAAVPTARTS